MAQEAVFAVLERGATIAVDEAKFLSNVSDKVEEAKKQLMRIRGFLKDVENKMVRGDAMARNLLSDVRDIAYEVEDIIDTANILTRQSDPKTSITGAICKYACFPVYLTHLHKLGARIDSATEKIKTILEDFTKLQFVATAIVDETRGYITEDDALQAKRSVHPDFGKQADVIGFDDQIKQIKKDLLDGENRDLTVISIVGPGGAGKSTLAKMVYGLVAGTRDFEVRAWITVSQRFVTRDILKEMIKCTRGSTEVEHLDKKSDDEVKRLLHGSLKWRRSLIVLDDVWSTDAWDMIRAAFPDNKNGSRVVLTTRNEAVGEYPDARKQIYKPKLLDNNESTELLLRTAFPAYDSVDSSRTAATQNLDELKKMSKGLAVKCGGLPLAIVVLGGYLSRNLDIAEWKRLTGSDNWYDMIGDEKGIGGILDLSYYDMPSHLRSCFMYTTAFPEGSCIEVRALVRLWVAEGFIPLVRGHTREEVAVKHINELVQRCMIQVEKRASSSGRIMVIKVHDILRDWGIRQARKEGLMKDCHAVEDVQAAYSEETLEAYRVVLYGFLAKEVGVSMRKLRTLLSFKLDKVEEEDKHLLFFTLDTVVAKSFPRLHHVGKVVVKAFPGLHDLRVDEVVAKSFQGLHHLRVLYLHSSAREMHLPGEIGRMRYLRYLGFGGTCIYHLPPSTANLLSVEIVDATGGVIGRLPGSLLKIRALRHVHVWANDWSMPQLSSQSKLHVTVLGYKDLRRGCFCCPCFGPEDDEDLRLKQRMKRTKQHISQKKNPNLSCCFGMMYEFEMSYQMDIVGRCKERLRFPNDHLDFPELEMSRGPIEVLKICCANLLSDDQKMLGLGSMERLRMLEIGERSYAGAVMTFFSNSFPCLECLVLYDLAVEKWNMERGSMRALRKLMLCNCPNLRSLPEGLSQLQLTKLDLIAMPPCCSQPGTVAQELKKKGCEVIVSSNEKDFHHLDVPVFDL